MAPVAVNEADCGILILSAGRFMSPKPAMTRHHLQAGAQKKIVLGPAGWSRSERNLLTKAICFERRRFD